MYIQTNESLSLKSVWFQYELFTKKNWILKYKQIINQTWNIVKIVIIDLSLKTF